jgi:uncharacterized protein YfaS (alpha-2-macroglobulin family)
MNQDQGVKLPLAIPVLMLAFAILATILGALVGCGAPVRPASTPELQVISFAPLDETESSEKPAPIRIRFNRPVVAEEQVGALLSQVPIVVHPAVRVAASWTDRQTLLVRPLTRLRPSTRYRVAFTGALPEVAGGGSFSYVHRPLAIERLSGVDLGSAPPRPSFALRFNQPVEANLVASRCGLLLLEPDPTGAGKRTAVPGVRPVPVTTPDPALRGTTVELEAAARLEQGRDYQLRCGGLIGVGGDAPIEEAFTRTLHVYDRFRVIGFRPQGGDVAADEVQLELTFSTPVRLEAVRRALRLSPFAAKARQGWLSADGKRYTTELDLATSTQHTVALERGMVDAHGQRLEGSFRSSFKTGDASPRLTFEKGIYALEASAEGYPVWTRNLSRFEVECASVPKTRIVRLLTSEMSYDPWFDASRPDQVGWSSLGLRPRTSQTRVARARNKWQLHQLKLKSLCGGGASTSPRGLFFAELRSSDLKLDPGARYRYRPRQRVLANVTDLGVLLKAGTASGLVWVARLSDGKPVAGAVVTIFSTRGKRVHSGRTGKDGVLALPGVGKLLAQGGAQEKDSLEENGGEDFDAYRSQRLIAIVEKGDDLAVVDGNWSNGIQVWNFDLPTDRRGGLRRTRGFIQSDRGIYRPGETVHFKGLVREIQVGELPRVPRARRIAITVEDGRGATILERALELSSYGGFAFDLPLSSEAVLGDYHVSATLGRQTFREKFQVEEFRKLSFELKLRSGERHLRIGKRIELALDARYLFGAPVKNAPVKWRVQRRSHLLSFPGYPSYSFTGDGYRSRWLDDEEQRPLELVGEGEGTTDANGRLRLSLRDPMRKLFEGPQDYLARVSVTDETDQSVQRTMVISAHPSDFYLGVHTQEYVQAVAMPFAVNLVALAPDGTQRATAATLHWTRQRAECRWSVGYRAYPTCTRKQERVWSRAIRIPATGVATERILPRDPGEFLVEVEATDARGVKVKTGGSVWVIGKGEAFWSGDESARTALIASKPSYRPGEVARLVPRADLAGATALLSVERNGVLETRLVSLKTTGEGIELPIKESYAPNVFVSLALVRGRSGKGDRGRPQFKLGMVNLQVSTESQRLRVEVQTERSSYQPGEEVSGTIRVRAGDRGRRAEVSLSVADEGVLQLIAYRTPDPIKAFYAPWGLGVDSATNWNRIARLNDPSEIDPEEGGDGPGGSAPKVRSRFVNSAFWAPALTTDAEGRASFRFLAPDNLTAFRLMAVAADDSGSRFGSGEQRITVAKPLLLSPILPRFLSTGDRASVGVTLHNHTGSEGAALLRLKAAGVRVRGASSRRVRLARDGSARVFWEVVGGEGVEARFQVEASLGAHADAFRITLPIARGLVVDKALLARGVLEGEGRQGKKEVAVRWPSDVHLAASMLELSVDRTGLSELEESLKYLVEYPYGCLEQTLSRLLPLLKVKDLARSLELAQLRGPKLQTFIRAGVEKVIRHQHDDGQFSLWPGSPVYPHLTAYAVYGLNEARRGGVAVEKSALERGARALKRWANASERMLERGGESGTVAMAAYVLAELGQADAGLNARLYEARRGLPRYGQAFLLRALRLATAPAEQIQKLKGELLDEVVDQGETAVLRERDPRLSYTMSSDVRSTAILLSALLAVDPRHRVVRKLAEGLKRAQRSNGRWYNTQENQYALIALADYARDLGRGAATVTVSLEGKPLARQTLKGGRVLSLRLPLARLRQGTLELASRGSVHYSVRLALHRRDERAGIAVVRGLGLKRRYLDPTTLEPVTRIKLGQLVKVRVEVTSETERHYIAVSDPIPAGLEAQNPKLATSAASEARRPAWAESSTWTWSELRDQRVLGFSDNLRPGTHVFEYLARATIAGRFRAAPAQVEAMYDPDLIGRSPLATIEVVR